MDELRVLSTRLSLLLQKYWIGIILQRIYKKKIEKECPGFGVKYKLAFYKSLKMADEDKELFNSILKNYPNHWAGKHEGCSSSCCYKNAKSLLWVRTKRKIRKRITIF